MSCVKIPHEISNCSLSCDLTWKLPSRRTIKFDVISSMAIELRVSRIGRKHRLKPLERFFAASIDSLSHRPTTTFSSKPSECLLTTHQQGALTQMHGSLYSGFSSFFGCCPYMVSGSFNNNETMREDFFRSSSEI